MKKEIIYLLQQLVEHQKKNVLKCGQQFVPNLTYDDILQPNDFSVLETNPHFRYEEGILTGIQSAQAALQGLLQKENT